MTPRTGEMRDEDPTYRKTTYVKALNYMVKSYVGPGCRSLPLGKHLLGFDQLNPQTRV